jgi:cathepsin F
MIKTLVALACVAVVAFAAHIALPDKAELTGLDMLDLFQQFKAKFSRNYSSNEELRQRYANFKANVARAQYLNKNSRATHGITQFMDMSQAEFRKNRLMNPRPVSQMRNNKAKHQKILNDKDFVNDPLPRDWDWRKKGAVTPVKDQQQCGSCWAFSVTGAIEGATFLKTGKLVSLSEQNLVDCDHYCSGLDRQSCDNGCDGGLMENAMEYVIGNGGIDTEDSYPYTAYDGTCAFKKENIGAKITSWSRGSHNETVLAAQLIQFGTISIGMDATTMQTYTGGMLDSFGCSADNIDHGISIVGYAGYPDDPYWIVKNSWNSGWGEDGYCRVSMGHNVCGIAQVPVIAHP